jgi:hypothetical protein
MSKFAPESVQGIDSAAEWVSKKGYDALRTAAEQIIAGLKATTPVCEKHAPSGGTRGGCVICSDIKETKMLEEKLHHAIEYLRQREKYVLEFPFVPTKSIETDVKKTMQNYSERHKVRGRK